MHMNESLSLLFRICFCIFKSSHVVFSCMSTICRHCRLLPLPWWYFVAAISVLCHNRKNFACIPSTYVCSSLVCLGLGKAKRKTRKHSRRKNANQMHELNEHKGCCFFGWLSCVIVVGLFIFLSCTAATYSSAGFSFWAY